VGGDAGDHAGLGDGRHQAQAPAAVRTRQHVEGKGAPQQAEGLIRPVELADELTGLSAGEVRLVMRDNLAGLSRGVGEGT